MPVVSVGNITLGGTGKTPAVEWLARWFTSKGLRVALVSRGYGASRAIKRRGFGIGGEAARRAARAGCRPGAAARRAIAEPGQLILLDDAFQHRRIARDLDIVLVDALEPFGYEHVFPRGTLREPLEGWRRADVVMLTRRELIAPEEAPPIRDQARSHAPGAVWAEATYTPRALRQTDGVEIALGAFAASAWLLLRDRQSDGISPFADRHRL